METEYVIYKTTVAEHSWDEVVLKFVFSYPTEKEAIEHVKSQLSVPSNLGPMVILKQYSPKP